MKWKSRLSIALLLCSPFIAAGYFLLGSDGSDLAKIHDGIEREFAKVNHIDGDDLSALNPKDIILFDVREPPEFTVSHLKGAIRINPGISAQEFIEKFSDITKGKAAIFYCSVGQRSSDLTDRVQGALVSSGTKAAYNLEGGIFKWHNEHRPLYTSSAISTEYVHPYNPNWGGLVKDQKHTRY